MSGKITQLTAIPAIDRTADVLEIVDVSADASYKVTPNNLVGISGGSVVSTSDSQSLTNKTLDNTNTYTAKDTLFTLQDDGDTSKQAKFQLSGITTSTTRTYTFPDASTTLVGTGATQTLTNKTITSPAITGGTLDNTTVTVDSISGHTSASVVTIAGLQISAGVVGSNGVATASIADAAVTPAKLVAGTGTGWAFQSWSPTWTNLTVGNGTVTAKYVQIGKTVVARIGIVFGSTSSISGSVTFTLPVTSVTYPLTSSAIDYFGGLEILDSGTTRFSGDFTINDTTHALVTVYNSASTYVTGTPLSSTIPMTWTTNDGFSGTLIYEAA